MKKGQRIALSNGRRLVDDVTNLARKIPSAGLSGDFDLSSVDQLRRLTRPKLSWNVLYLKAFGIVAEKTPALNQLYVKFPWPHFYQHHAVVCMMTMTREYRGEERLFFARFNNPQKFSLSGLQEKYDYFRNESVENIRQFKHQIRFAKAPWLLRRLGWWTMFQLWPAKRASHVGTIGMSFSGYRGVYGNQHLAPLTSILGIDPCPRKGIAHLVHTFDHRVLDGIPAASVLSSIHQTLCDSIRTEMKTLISNDRDEATTQISQRVA